MEVARSSAVRRCPGDGGPRRPTFPLVTVVVRCDLVVRGLDVAPAVTTLEGYPPPMAFHRWASDASAGLSRHVRASILIPTAAKAPRISRRMMIQITGGFLLPPSPASFEQPAPRVSGALVTALAPPVWRVRLVPGSEGVEKGLPSVIIAARACLVPPARLAPVLGSVSPGRRCEAIGRVSPRERPPPPGWRSCAAAPPRSPGTPPG